jgi:hypothetical protein
MTWGESLQCQMVRVGLSQCPTGGWIKRQGTGRGPPCSMYSLVIDNVHANPMVKCVLHAEYVLSRSGAWSTFSPCSGVTGHM